MDVLFYILCWQVLVIKMVDGQNLDAKMNSYHVHVTANKEGTMLKYISPETDVKSTMTDMPKVDVSDAKLLTAMITKANADIVLLHPKMSVDGKFPEYTYVIPKKNKTHFYNIEKIVHPPDYRLANVKSVVNSKPGNEKSKTPQVQQDINCKDGDGSCEEELVSSAEEIDHDEAQGQSADGPQDETLTSNEDEEQNESEFPPKVPHIPIELGSSNLKGGNDKIKETGSISKQQRKPCQENCSDTYSEPEEETNETTNPPQDIPIELGMMETGKNNNGERITYINHKTPKEFVLLETENQRNRRSIPGVTSKSGIHTGRKNKHNDSKRWKKESVKRSDISEDQELLKTLENFNSQLKSEGKVRSNIKSKPLQKYMSSLANDVRDVMGQAKKVLTNTGEVVHALKRVLNGASALSSFTKNAENVAKYFSVEPNNATIDYLEEKAIVAVLEAQKAASVAKEAAEFARRASIKAKAVERRMEVMGEREHPVDDTVMRYVNIASAQADRAEKAAMYAAGEKAKTEHDVRYVDKTLRKLTKTLKDKEDAREIKEKTFKIIEESKASGLLPTSTVTSADTIESHILSTDNDEDSKIQSKHGFSESNDDSGIVRDRTPTPASTTASVKNPYETLNEQAYSKYFLFKQKQLEKQLKQQHIREETPTKKSVMLRRHMNSKLKGKHVNGKNEEILSVKSKISSLSNRLEQVIKSIKNSTLEKVFNLNNKNEGGVRRYIKPVHIKPGEYTGFKKNIVTKVNQKQKKERSRNEANRSDIRSDISTSDETDMKDTQQTIESVDQELEDLHKREGGVERPQEIIPNAEQDETGSGENEGNSPDTQSSKIEKGQVTVTVNVRHHVKKTSKGSNHPADFETSKSENLSEKSRIKPTLDDEDVFGFKTFHDANNPSGKEKNEDPFGFKKLEEVDTEHAKENNFLDPFKFKQDTNEGAIYDRAHIPKPGK